MGLEACIGRGLFLKSHRVRRVLEEPDGPLAEIEWIPGRLLICSRCWHRRIRIHAREGAREWRDLSARDRPVVLRDAPVRGPCPACGPRVEHLPWGLGAAYHLGARGSDRAAVAPVELEGDAGAPRSGLEDHGHRRAPGGSLGLEPSEPEALARHRDRRGLAWHRRREPFIRFARMIRGHLDGILAWTHLRVANGALAGMNDKVKVISHRAYGFRRPDHYITAIRHGCGNLPLECTRWRSGLWKLPAPWTQIASPPLFGKRQTARFSTTFHRPYIHIEKLQLHFWATSPITQEESVRADS